ncbi:hypothetical protein ACKS0A_02254 [Histoplasma ohiense]
MSLFPFMLKIMAYTLPGSQVFKHLTGGDEMITSTSRNSEHSITKPWGFRTVSKDIFLL